jgi:hypothetical protein
VGGLGDLEDRACSEPAAAFPVPPELRCAEQVTVSIGDQVERRDAGENQSGWGAGVALSGLDDFEYRATSARNRWRPALRCRTEQVAVGIGDQPG